MIRTVSFNPDQPEDEYLRQVASYMDVIAWLAWNGTALQAETAKIYREGGYPDARSTTFYDCFGCFGHSVHVACGGTARRSGGPGIRRHRGARERRQCQGGTTNRAGARHPGARYGKPAIAGTDRRSLSDSELERQS